MNETPNDKVQNKESTVNVLLNVCNDNCDQYKRIIEALENDSDTKRARLYADAGLLFSQTCIRDYTQTSISTLPERLDLQREVVEASSGSNHQNPLRENTPERSMTDMEWVNQFFDEYNAAKKKMSWQVCFNKGKEAGFFQNYTKYISLKSAYHRQKKNNKKFNIRLPSYFSINMRCLCQI